MEKHDGERSHSLASDQSSESGNSSKAERTLSGEQIKKCLFICSFAFMMNYAAYGGLVFLQSSMNIEEGLGTVSLFAVFVTSSLSTILLIPFLIDFMGAKTAIVLGEIGIIAFTAANFYPTWYTMMPVAVFHGLTESASWAGAAVYVTYLGEQYWQLKCKRIANTKKKREAYVYRFISVFYVFVYLAQVIGNAMVYFVLHTLKDKKIRDHGSEDSSTLPPNSSFPSVVSAENSIIAVNESDDLQYCGAQECQGDFIYSNKSEKLDKYKPNQMSIYLLLAIFFAIQIVFTLVHAFGIPKIPAKLHTRREEARELRTSREDLEPVLKPTSRRSNSIWNAVSTEIKQTFCHIVSPLHLLVFPIIIYYGIFTAFNVTEFTRAYVSCVIGVEQVGLAMVIYGLSSMAISLLSTKILPLLGRSIVYLMVLFMHLSIYLLCLLWQPSHSESWMIYVMAGSLGCCDGIATNLFQVMIAVYFEQNLGIAFSVKNFATNLGIVVGTGISTSLCVHTKLHILISLLGISSVLFVGAELFFRSKKSSGKERAYQNT